jgi:DNA modification methylase
MIVKEKNGEGFLDLRICDNLELMAEIKDNTIDLIYCDILYGTGRKFKDYQDLKPIRSEIESHYIPRIKEMHRILKDNGSIYLQMDTRINHWLRCIMDDVFGYKNIVNEIIWNYSVGGKGNTCFAKKHDVIYFYSKTKKYVFNYKDIKVPLSPNKHDKKGIDYGGRNGIDENGKRYVDKWGTGRKKLYRYYLDDGKIPEDVWNDINTLHHRTDEYVDYTTQKPKALIERIIKASSNEGDLVADFYSGSFTTAEVCKDLKRNFIGCDINPNCFEKAKERGLFSFTDEPTNVD